MSGWKKLASAAAASGEVLNVEDVFSTHLYTGTNSAQTITNGIDLAGEGGLIWLQNRTTATYPTSALFDSEIATVYGTDTFPVVTRAWDSDSAGTLGGYSPGFTYTSTGFTTSGRTDTDESGVDYVTWSFRKCPKFFDVVSYIGNSTSGRTISHNLGAVPAMIIIMGNGTGDYWVYHKDVGNTKYLELNKTSVAQTSSSAWNNTTPTDSVFTVGNGVPVNYNNYPYTAFIFADNDGDGEFGPNGDQDIIKCGSYTGNGNSNGPEIDLGFEPQWIMIKEATSSSGNGNWWLADKMRGASETRYAYLKANSIYDENYLTNPYITIKNNGFKINQNDNTLNENSQTYVYVAIRNGPMAVPESATDVFDIYDAGTSNPADIPSDIVVDAYLTDAVNNYASNRNAMVNRLTDTKILFPSETIYEANVSNAGFRSQTGLADISDSNGWLRYSGNDQIYYMWRRAPNFFDVVTYTGTGTYGDTINHNLGATPEMMWVKRRNGTSEWHIYHKGIDVDADGTDDADVMYFDTDAPVSNNRFAFTPPTDTVFSVGGTSDTNASSVPYVAYLFASLDGISKVGSYTGTGSSQNIDCGFSSGARFILLRRADSTASHWYLFDAERGITTGSDPTILPSSNSAEVSVSAVAPYSSGFTVTATNNIFNGSGINYIFYAIA